MKHIIAGQFVRPARSPSSAPSMAGRGEPECRQLLRRSVVPEGAWCGGTDGLSGTSSARAMRCHARVARGRCRTSRRTERRPSCPSPCLFSVRNSIAAVDSNSACRPKPHFSPPPHPPPRLLPQAARSLRRRKRCDNRRRDRTPEGLDVDDFSPLRTGPIAAVAARRAGVVAGWPFGAPRQRSGRRPGPDGVLRCVCGGWSAQRAV